MATCYILYFLNSFREAEGHRAKIKRAVLQFTPESWTKNEWFGSTALKRTLAVYLFVMIWLVRFLILNFH